MQNLGGAGHATFDFVLGHFGVFQTKGQVSLDRHLWVQRVGLEHHANAAFGRFGPRDVLPFDVNLTVGDFQQTRDAIQQG